MLAASVAFAGALGAMAGALGTSVFARPQPAAAETPTAAVDLTAVRDTIASLRTEIGAIKSSVDSSNRNANAQFAKFNERLERIDRAQAAPAAQLKQAMEAIDRLEKRVQAQGRRDAPDRCGRSRPRPRRRTGRPPPPSRPRARVIDGWTVRHVSRGVAVIQGRRIGAIEVEAGDVVPGVGRIESIRRQDGRWVVLTSNGMITVADAALDARSHLHECAMPGPTPGHFALCVPRPACVAFLSRYDDWIAGGRCAIAARRRLHSDAGSCMDFHEPHGGGGPPAAACPAIMASGLCAATSRQSRGDGARAPGACRRPQVAGR